MSIEEGEVKPRIHCLTSIVTVLVALNKKKYATQKMSLLPNRK